MYFIYLKSNGAISDPVKTGKPDDRTMNKEADCGIGSGMKWDTNDLFYAPDGEFPDDFQEWAATGKYFVDTSVSPCEIIENEDWEEPAGEKNGDNK